MRASVRDGVDFITLPRVRGHVKYRAGLWEAIASVCERKPVPAKVIKSFEYEVKYVMDMNMNRWMFKRPSNLQHIIERYL